MKAWYREGIAIKTVKDLMLVTLVLVLIVTGALLLKDRDRREDTPFSTWNPNDRGCLASYLLFDELGFSVGRFERSCDLSDAEVLVVLYPVNRSIPLDGRKEILDWTAKGNILVVADRYTDFFQDAGDGLEVDTGKLLIGRNILEDRSTEDMLFKDLPHYNGVIRIIPDADLFINSELRKEGTAYDLVTALWDLGEKSILFYEYWEEDGINLMLGSGDGISGAFMLLPLPGRFMLVQAIIGLVLMIAFTGWRIGPPETNREFGRRKDNEDIHAAAGMMSRLKLKETALNLYFSDFKRDASRFFGKASEAQIIESWGGKGLSHIELLKKVFRACTNKEGSSDYSEGDIVKLINIMDILLEEMDRHKGVKKSNEV